MSRMYKISILFVLGMMLVLSSPLVLAAGGTQETSASQRVGTEEPEAASGNGNPDEIAAGAEEEVVSFSVSTPPDPNFIPLAVLREKADEWMPGVEVEIVTAPAGDPGAMRAMVQKKSADFALFNALGGSKFYSNGLTNLRLVGVHVWKGVYLLAQESVKDINELEGETLAAVPSVKTPPHMLSMKVLTRRGVSAQFVAAGSGPSLMALLSRPERAPKAFVAPEPMVSIILAKQKQGDWPVRYRVFIDPQEELNPDSSEIPLGALWLLDPDIAISHREQAQTFVAGFDRAVDYAQDPANVGEVAEIVAGAMGEVFGQGAGAPVYRMMLSSGRLGLDFRPAEEIVSEVTVNLKKLYGFEVDESEFCRNL